MGSGGFPAWPFIATNPPCSRSTISLARLSTAPKQGRGLQHLLQASPAHNTLGFRGLIPGAAGALSTSTSLRRSTCTCLTLLSGCGEQGPEAGITAAQCTPSAFSVFGCRPAAPGSLAPVDPVQGSGLGLFFSSDLKAKSHLFCFPSGRHSKHKPSQEGHHTLASRAACLEGGQESLVGSLGREQG